MRVLQRRTATIAALAVIPHVVPAERHLQSVIMTMDAALEPYVYSSWICEALSHPPDSQIRHSSFTHMKLAAAPATARQADRCECQLLCHWC